MYFWFLPTLFTPKECTHQFWGYGLFVAKVANIKLLGYLDDSWRALCCSCFQGKRDLDTQDLSSLHSQSKTWDCSRCKRCIAGWKTTKVRHDNQWSFTNFKWSNFSLLSYSEVKHKPKKKKAAKESLNYFFAPPKKKQQLKFHLQEVSCKKWMASFERNYGAVPVGKWNVNLV